MSGHRDLYMRKLYSPNFCYAEALQNRHLWWTDLHAWLDGYAWFDELTELPDLIPTLLFPSNIYQSSTSKRRFFIFNDDKEDDDVKSDESDDDDSDGADDGVSDGRISENGDFSDENIVVYNKNDDNDDDDGDDDDGDDDDSDDDGNDDYDVGDDSFRDTGMK